MKLFVKQEKKIIMIFLNDVRIIVAMVITRHLRPPFFFFFFCVGRGAGAQGDHSELIMVNLIHRT